MAHKMDMCTCSIKLGGSLLQVVQRYARNPVSYPEIEVLKFMHGETSVQDIEVCGTVVTTAKEEKLRLCQLYPPKLVEQIYPGQAPAGVEFQHPSSENTLGGAESASPKRRGRKPKAAKAEEGSPFQEEAEA